MDAKYIEKISSILPIIDHNNPKQLYKGLGTLLVEKNNRPLMLELQIGFLVFLLDYKKEYELHISIKIDDISINTFITELHKSPKKINVGDHYIVSYAPEMSIKDYPLGVYDFYAELKSGDDILDTGRLFLLVGEVDSFESIDY